jgi:hypothetical protein
VLLVPTAQACIPLGSLSVSGKAEYDDASSAQVVEPTRDILLLGLQANKRAPRRYVPSWLPKRSSELRQELRN